MARRRGVGRMAGAAAEGVMRPLRRVVRDGEELADVATPPRPRTGPNDFADPAHLRTNRPKLRTTTKRAVFRDAPRAPNGHDFVDPNGKIIPCKRDANGNPLLFNDKGKPDPNGYTHPVDNPVSGSGQPDNYHFGHVPDSEYRRLVQVADDYPNTVTNKDFRDAYNDPKHYQIEDPPGNVGHGDESTTPGYGHYDHLVPPTPTGQSP